MARVAVVGANGRVGAALVEHLSGVHEVVPILRSADESLTELAERATSGVEIVLNAAGVAHVERESPEEVERLRAGNVELPLFLAEAALAARAHLVHISSVKAVGDAKTAYGRSKYEGERALEDQFGDSFADAGLCLVLVRPLAMLIPPFDAGKISRLGWLRYWPRVLTPAVRVPVITSQTFFAVVESLSGRIVSGNVEPGMSVQRFTREDRATVRDLRGAIGTAAEP